MLKDRRNKPTTGDILPRRQDRSGRVKQDSEPNLRPLVSEMLSWIPPKTRLRHRTRRTGRTP